MVNNINNNSYGRSIYGQGDINNINKNQELQNNKVDRTIQNQISNESIGKTESLQNKEVAQFLKKIQEEISKAQLISIKIVRGEKPTKNELNFLKSKYPDMKQIAEQSLKECNNLKEAIKYCKTGQEIEKIISKALDDISKMIKNGSLSEVQAKIKTSALDEVIKYSNKIQNEFKKAESVVIKLIKGEKLSSSEENLIKEKYPELNKLAKESLKECNILKEKLKACDTQNQRDKLISKEVRNIEEKGKLGLLSKTEVKIKMIAINEAASFSNKEQSNLKKTILLASKIINGEKLIGKENQFIKENNIDLKKLIQESVVEYKYLKEALKNCKSEDQKQQIVNNEFNNIEDMAKRGVLGEINARIKMMVIEDMKEDEYERREKDKEKNFLYYLNPFIYIMNGNVAGKIGIVIFIIAIISILYIL
ncbi:hypothetical protein [Romboutsia lituseburensis]|uniref:hypothetical protein n=1 Tax=Romboutsia lituseburensis TaxID=1537 RepID=UPI00215B67C9|nr:hypothetical protein [Romboutsia lituseburensis]MCR8747054.1 hypothetical protein [Romboutsia lituseburensis]